MDVLHVVAYVGLRDRIARTANDKVSRGPVLDLFL